MKLKSKGLFPLLVLGSLLWVSSHANAQTTVQEWVVQGEQFSSVGKFDKAFEAFNKALELDPNSVRALIGRGEYLYWFADDQAKALATAEKAAALKPKDANLLKLLAELFASLKMPDRSFDYYEQALAIAPQSRETLEDRARLLEDTARDRNNDPKLLERSLADYTVLVGLFPLSELYWLRRGYVNSDLGRHEAAIADFTEALVLNKESFALLHRANSYLALKRYDEALVEFQKQNSGESYAGQAQIYAVRNDLEQSIKFWNWAVLADSYNDGYLRGRAEVLRRLNRLDEAQADEKKAAELAAAQ